MDDKTRERFERIEANLDILTKLHLDYHREHEERIAEHEKRMAEQDRAIEEIQELTRRVVEIGDRLAGIVIDHERRINRLEDGE